MNRFVVAAVLFVALELASTVPVPHVAIPFCPASSRPMYKPDGEPRKCLPHQSNLCLNAADDKADISSICCWYNQVDYFCCSGIPSTQCPEYQNVTVVIHNTQPMGPNPLKVFHFRKGIEDEIEFTN
ncbi:hypothetical protein M3Y97_01044100 [Aphelenchoides bicaudatus]|nr:hypothetical protein M3Y97_01044100 [Aphelenchoides bicaudatus]